MAIRERGKPIDSSTELPDGTQVNNSLDFRLYRAKSGGTTSFAIFVRGYWKSRLDGDLPIPTKPPCREFDDEVKSDGYRAETLVRAIVTSEPFLKQNTRE